jgi:RiboL-PSP-HEPN
MSLSRLQRLPQQPTRGYAFASSVPAPLSKLKVNKHTQWPPARIRRLEAQLDRLVNAVSDGTAREVDDQIWLTRFLVVRSCGYLEQVVHETVVTHLQAGSYGTAQSFVMSWLDRSRNPSVDNLLRMIGRLDGGMQEELDQLLMADDGRLTSQIASLVGRRNQIVHGENEGMGSQAALELTRSAKIVANWFIRRLDPDYGRFRR